MPCFSEATWSLPVPQKGLRKRRTDTGRHRWALSGAFGVQLTDFGTISASPEQSLTLPETTPPGWGRLLGGEAPGLRG